MPARRRRAITTLAVVLLALLGTATGVATDRLRTPGAADPGRTTAIEPGFEFVSAVTAPAAPKPKPARRAVAARTAGRVATCPAMPPVSAAPSTAAQAVVPRVTVYDAPDGRASRTLTNPTDEGQDLYALVRGKRAGWLRIQLVTRPNGTTGWVRASDFTTRVNPFHIVVQRCAKRLTVFQNGVATWTRTVAVGKPRTPTPRGELFVDFVTRMHCCAYGPFMLSIGGFSDVLHQFGNGGTGQIAIHGTNADWSVGKAASNGCVRMHNADVTILAGMIPGGTPVTIVD
jgi:lipoprotein-anchoring transpeptidase ErfK/SrfK